MEKDRSQVTNTLCAAYNQFLWPFFIGTIGLRPVHYLNISKKSKIKSGDKVLEIGCNYPLWKLYSSKVGHDGLFIAVDLDHSLQKRADKMRKAIEFISEGNKEREHLAVADGAYLPFKNNSFDLVIASNFVGPSEYKEDVLRILKPGGSLLLSWADLIYPKRTIEDLNHCKEIGYTDVKLSPGLPGFIGAAILIQNPLPLFSLWNWFVEAKKPRP